MGKVVNVPYPIHRTWISRILRLNSNYCWKLFLATCTFLLFYTFFWTGDNEEAYYPKGNPCILSSSRCIKEIPRQNILTAECPSRLGNQMFSYAILYAISSYNNRHAYMSPSMSSYISKYFKASLPTLDDDLYKSTTWVVQYLGGIVPPNIRNLTATAPIKFCCYPQVYAYFHEIRPTILREFQFQNWVHQRANQELNAARLEFFQDDPESKRVTFIGVHIRRTDYLAEKERTKFHLASVGFYTSAMRYFQTKYPNAIFILASDDIPWCLENFSRLDYRIHYIRGTTTEDGGVDLAVLSKCHHMVFGMGTFGFWAAYLNPGEVIYCSDCITKESVWLTDPLVYGGNYSNFVLPEWKGISRDGVS